MGKRMKYLMIKRWDNGYNCSCCRKSGIELEELVFNSSVEESPQIDGRAIEDAKSQGFTELYRLATENLL